MAGKFFGKVFDMIGLEENTVNEEEYDYDEYGDDGYDDYDDSYDNYDDGYDDYGDEDYYEEKKPARQSKIRSIYRGRREQEPVQNYDGPSTGNSSQAGRMRMVVYQPMTYDDTQSIVDNLKNRKPVIVNLESMEIDIAQRVLDFMSGAVYAVNGNIHKVTKGIFILVPTNVDISGNIPDDLSASNSFYTLGSNRRRDY
ncbi:cell division protein SepF [Eubacteriales bacterium OttesenSCG-928-M02]|nr:cell division protein SepF [Eubacteriales bacterium OttesenSCG-928-M02]